MEADYLDKLNPQQRGAVLHTEGPTMIIAGAGSGKTRVLTYRIAHLLSQGVDPYNILALTFTNKAAREMRLRIEKLVGPQARSLWMGTFHSVFARILRSEADKLGYPRHFTIYDTDDARTLIRQILKELNLDDKIYKPAGVLGRISAAKNKLITVEQYLNDVQVRRDDEAAQRPATGEIYRRYQQRCFKAGAMDFDDLLFQTNVLFRDHTDALNKYQHLFKHVLVDEYQDTNYSQYLITRKLAALNRNICVVGDDAQSIYAFRGADITNILNFERDYPELTVFKLEQNYRSTKTIVKAANSVIKHNKAQLRKDVFSENEDGPLIEVLRATSDNEEGRLVAHSIFEERANHHLSYENFAILYRTNAQSRSLEEALRRMNIKYRIVGGLSFYQRKEIKDLVAYLRLAINANDEQALRRVINYPKRGIGDTTIEKLVSFAAETNHDLWEIVCSPEAALGKGRAANGVKEFAETVQNFQQIAAKENASEAAKYIAKRSGVLDDLYVDKSIEGIARYENLQELLNGVSEFVDNPERDDKSLGAFLQEISLLTDADSKGNEQGEHVTMMTIHSAKGLEFRNVYIVGMEENLFPSQMAIGSRAELEEERRLFYVAITRAEKRLTMSYATSRYQWGNLRPCEPSRFLGEVDPLYVKVKFLPGNVVEEEPGPFGRVLERKTATRNLITPPVRPQQATNYVAPADFQPSDTSNLQAGMRVEHPKFGFGQVKSVAREPAGTKAVVQFEEVGEKTLLLAFAKLRIH